MYRGFIKVAAAIPHVRVADITYNTQEIERIMALAEERHVEVLTFPELSITGYSCQDLFQQQTLLEETEHALLHIMTTSHSLRLTTIVGLPIVWNGMLLNCAAVIQGGHLHGIVAKTYLPGYREFYEQRWFSSATLLPTTAAVHICGQQVPISANLIFSLSGAQFAIEICEDLWTPIPPSCHHALSGADIIFNLSASNDVIGKNDQLVRLIQSQSSRCIAGYVYASCGYGESTQDLIYGGKAFICENGQMLAEAKRYSLEDQLIVSEIDIESLRHERIVKTSFACCAQQEERGVHQVIVVTRSTTDGEGFTLTRPVRPLPFVPEDSVLAARCEEIICMQSEGLITRLVHTHAESVVIGISGGLDSTLALLVCIHAFDRLNLSRKGIVGITMPGFGTTDRTYTNAINLMKALGVTIREINIADAVSVHFRDLGHDGKTQDVVYENAQARERTQILMDAANQVGGFVIGTGDLSELALGWATYNGDHMSMYAVNVSIPKTLLRHLVSWVAANMEDPYSRATLEDIVATPISPELIPADTGGQIAQKTEDLVGPYELHDFFLYHTLRHGRRPATVYYLACQAFGDPHCAHHYDEATIKKWLRTFYRRFFAQQYKRSCLPDGPKVGECSLSPRGDWRMPSDAVGLLWLEECESL